MVCRWAASEEDFANMHSDIQQRVVESALLLCGVRVSVNQGLATTYLCFALC